jgi:hypothetical protein
MRSHRVIRWLAVPALGGGTAFAAPTAASAQQAPPEPPPQQARQSVGISPVGATRADPNGGFWFVLELAQGQHGESKVRVANPADVPQTVKLFLTDVDFSSNGSPQLADHPKDVGTWGAFANPVVTVPARSAIEVPFTVTVPNDAEPGDHVGAVVAQGAPESQGEGALLQVVHRVASRLYVTVPGEARADVNIAKVTLKRDSSFFTRQITATVMLHNTGRVRVQPTVYVNGKKATGSALLLSRSVEPYIASVNVPVWGGPVSVRVETHTKVGAVDGPVREATASTFVVPWVLLIGLVALVGFLFLVRWLWRKRGGKYAAIQADLRRFERLLQQHRADGEDTAAVVGDAELAIKAAIKQAGRSGDKDTEIRLREKLAELREQEAAPPPPPSAPPPAPPSPARVATAPAGNGNGNGNGHAREDDASLVAILRVLAVAPPGGQRFALVRAARHYGRDAIEAHPEELASLPEELRVRLLRAATHDPDPEPESVAPSEIA